MGTQQRIQDRLKPDTTFKISYGDNDDKDQTVDNPRFIIAYWSIRGLGAPLRMLLNAAQVNHWVIMYDVIEDKDGEGWTMESYLNEKKWLKDEYNAFMNLPFFVDCKSNRVIAQTNAIFAYLGRELKMIGTNEGEMIKCEELLCEVMDLRNVMVKYAYYSDVAKAKDDAEAMMKQIDQRLDKFELHLSKEYSTIKNSNKSDDDNNDEASSSISSKINHLIYNQWTVADFHLWEILDQYEGLVKKFDLQPFYNCTNLRKSLYEFKHSFEKLSENQHYLKGNEDDGFFSLSKALPYNNVYARFGSEPKELGQFVRNQDSPWKQKGVVVVKHSKDVNSKIMYQPEDNNNDSQTNKKRKLERRKSH